MEGQAAPLRAAHPSALSLHLSPTRPLPPRLSTTLCLSQFVLSVRQTGNHSSTLQVSWRDLPFTCPMAMIHSLFPLLNAQFSSSRLRSPGPGSPNHRYGGNMVAFSVAAQWLFCAWECKVGMHPTQPFVILLFFIWKKSDFASSAVAASGARGRENR